MNAKTSTKRPNVMEGPAHYALRAGPETWCIFRHDKVRAWNTGVEFSSKEAADAHLARVNR